MIKLTFYIVEQKIHSLILNTKLSYNNKSIDTKSDTKFLGIIMDRSYNGKLT